MLLSAFHSDISSRSKLSRRKYFMITELNRETDDMAPWHGFHAALLTQLHGNLFIITL